MPRGQRKKAEATEQQAAPVADASLTQIATDTVVDESADPEEFANRTYAEPPVPEFGEPPPDMQGTPDSVRPESGQRERFRSWVTDDARGYSRIADNEFVRIVLQFKQRPSPEILTALKDGGFHYQPDYLGHKSAWVRRNDYTGRVQVEAIEKLLRSQSAVPESVER